VLYAGEPGNPREKAFTEFLGAHFKKVDSMSLEKLSEASAEGYDVIVADWRRFYSANREEMGKGRAKVTLPMGWSRPTIMIARSPASCRARCSPRSTGFDCASRMRRTGCASTIRSSVA